MSKTLSFADRFLPEGEVALDFREVGAALGCSSSTVRRLVGAGKLTSLKVGNQNRIWSSEVRRQGRAEEAA